MSNFPKHSVGNHDHQRGKKSLLPPTQTTKSPYCCTTPNGGRRVDPFCHRSIAKQKPSANEAHAHNDLTHHPYRVLVDQSVIAGPNKKTSPQSDQSVRFKIYKSAVPLALNPHK